MHREELKESARRDPRQASTGKVKLMLMEDQEGHIQNPSIATN